MKLLTITVPCYNSTAYMRKCIDSLLPGGEDVEILVVDDGSTKDNTFEVAQEYEKRYPTIVRAIHQENKGHGGAVNTGIANATGLFFKVCDSDDWFDTSAYLEVLAALNRIVRGPRMVDAVFSNYVYEKVGRTRKYVMQYTRFMPQDRPFGWNELKKFDSFHYVLMHSIIYRTEILREVGLQMPEHTFYVDNIFAYEPFIKVKTMYYCNVNLYRYFIGRADQSVNEEVMFSRLPQQLSVNERMIDYLKTMRKYPLEPRQREYMLHYLSIITTITSTMMIRSGRPELLRQKNELWLRLKKTDVYAYWRIRRTVQGMALTMPGKSGRGIVRVGYWLTQKIYGYE